MGSLIHYEGWDGVTAPAIPSGWTVGSALATSSSPTGGISPISSPNVLACPATGNTTDYAATWDVADNNNGNVLVYASFNAASTTANQVYGVFARGSAYPIIPTSATFYWAQIRADTTTLRLYSVIGGFDTLLGTAVTISSLSTDDWYQIQLSCQSSTITVSVIRGSDGYSLNSAGNWQAAGAVAMSVSDTSITGAGYAGLTLRSKSDNLYTDEWYFLQYSGSPQTQPPPLNTTRIVRQARGRGMVLQPLAVRFGTPALPLFLQGHGIVGRDTSRDRRSIDHGRAWVPLPAPSPPPASIPFAFWRTVKSRDDSEVRRRIGHGLASTPRSFARLPVPPSIPFGYWETIRWSDPSERLRRINHGRAWAPAAVPMPGSVIYGGWTQQYISAVNPPVQYGTELYLSWESDAPPGLVFQVYENDQLVWTGSSTYCTLPLPSYLVRFDIGTIGYTNENVDFSDLLPPAPLLQAELTWLGGTFESPEISGFYVFGEEAPGAGIDYGEPLATVPAYTAGIITDGFGFGGFGQGAFGESAAAYAWTSDALTSGVWHFAVIPFDIAGNQGSGSTTAVTIVGPPGEPAPFADRSRLHYAYDATTQQALLTWNGSPG